MVLKVLQQLNKPDDIDGFDEIRDYPSSQYNDITTGKVKVENIEVVRGWFTLDDEDKKLIPEEYHNPNLLAILFFQKCNYNFLSS